LGGTAEFPECRPISSEMGGARQHFGWHNPMPICNHESAHVPDIGGVVHMPAWYRIIVGIGRCGVIWMKPRLRFGTVRKIPRAW